MYITRIHLLSNIKKNLIILLILILPLIPGGSLELAGKNKNCPSFCSCYTWYNLRWASCSGQHLYGIHTGVSDIVQALDISNNSISIVADFEFQKLGLVQLKYLNLSDNAISEIGLSGFVGLIELTVLDLSRNHLNYLLPNTFAENKNLRILRLAGNNFNQHVPFLENPAITELNFASCHLSHLPRGAFSGLKQLRSLDLSENSMIQLDEATLRVLPFLRILSIHNNPWACNTREMQSLQRYLTTKNIRYESSVCSLKIPQKTLRKKFERMRMSETSLKDLEKSGEIELPLNKKSGNDWMNVKTGTIVKKLPDDVIKVNDSMSVPWFLCGMGFITGLAVGIVFTYLALSLKSFSLCDVAILMTRANARRENSSGSLEYTNPAAQRASLLRNIWSNSDEELASLRRIPICPGTPPPPYHDVILHADRYPVS